MKFKKLGKRILSAALSAALLFGTASVCPEFSRNMQGQKVEAMPTPVSALVKAIGGRVVKEVSAYCMSNDVPVLGSACYLIFCDPSTRATMKANSQIDYIFNEVQVISKKLDTISGQLSYTQAYLEAAFANITNQLNNIQTDQRYINARAGISDYYNDYTPLWDEYCDILTEFNNLDKTSDYPTDETDGSENFQKVLKKYTNFMADNESYLNKLKIDISNIGNYICSDSFSYLPACEAYLRNQVPFEHQIAEEMYNQYQYTASLQIKMYTLYQDYIAYKYTMDNKDDFSTMTDKGFKELQTNIQEDCADLSAQLITNLNTQAEKSGIADLIVTPEFAEKLLLIQNEIKNEEENKIEYCIEDDYYEIQTYESRIKLYNEKTDETKQTITVKSDILDENNKEVEVSIDVSKEPTTLSVNGSSRYTYYVRDNVDLSYYMIEQSPFVLGEDITTWTNKAGVTSYRPDMMLDYTRSDDGRYVLISSDNIQAINKHITNNSIRGLLRNSGLNINQHTQAFLLSTYTKSVPSDYEAGNWKVNIWNDNNTVTTHNSKDLTGNKLNTMRIYRLSDVFDAKVIKPVDASDISGKTIVLDEGQTLDYSGIEINIDSVTIYTAGKCSIIGNPNIKLTNSTIYINTEKEVTLNNVNIQTWQYNDAAVIVINPNGNIKLEGTNKFTGNGGAVDQNKYSFYAVKDQRPVGASHGLLVNKDANLTLTGASGEFTGSGGGAGICPVGNITIKNAGIKASGSSNKITVKQYHEYKVYMGMIPVKTVKEFENATIYSVGAGIGASASFISGQNMQSDYKAATYKEYGKLTVDSSDINVTGAKQYDTKYPISYHIDSSACDIGGFNILARQDKIDGVFTNRKFDTKNVSGEISNSTLSMKYANLDSQISLADSNTYSYNEYEIKAYGDSLGHSTGVVTISDSKGNNASFNGYISGSFTAISKNTSLSDISNITLKLNSGQGAVYIDYLEIKAKIGNVSKKVYIGSVIDTTEKTFSVNDHVVKVEIKVPDQSTAGTDSRITLFLKDTAGNTSDTYHLDHADHNDFEQGNLETYYINAKNLGTITHAVIQSDQSGSSSGMKIGKITIESMQGNHTSETFSINANQWILSKDRHVFGKDPYNTGSYMIKIQTADVKKAGTDSDIVIRLEGEDGRITPGIEFTGICNDAGGSNDNACERGNLDTAYISYNHYGIGKLAKVHIDKDNSGPGPDWNVDYIEVTPVSAASASDTPSYCCDVDKDKDIKAGHHTFNVTSTKFNTDAAKSIQTRADSTESEAEQTVGKSFFLNVNKGYVIEQNVLEYIVENGFDVTFNIINDNGQNVYSLYVDGKTLASVEPINTLATVKRVNHGFLVSINDGKGVQKGVSVKINRSELPVELVSSEAVDEYKDIYIMRKLACGGVSDPMIITDDEELIIDLFSEMESVYFTHSKAIYNNALGGEDPELSLIGDVNNDGKVNVRDCAFIATALSKNESSTLPDTTDYNEDGKINVRDAAAIALALAKGV